MSLTVSLESALITEIKVLQLLSSLHIQLSICPNLIGIPVTLASQITTEEDEISTDELETILLETGYSDSRSAMMDVKIFLLLLLCFHKHGIHFAGILSILTPQKAMRSHSNHSPTA
ncbi:hypothetical protein MJO29_014873 [Puccinia striiformis f. sp. tritici]|nr:hypothetical protein MJO29_014873 [Puccinia striiformis f. sp. tritici]